MKRKKRERMSLDEMRRAMSGQPAQDKKPKIRPPRTGG